MVDWLFNGGNKYKMIKPNNNPPVISDVKNGMFVKSITEIPIATKQICLSLFLEKESIAFKNIAKRIAQIIKPQKPKFI